LGVAAFFEVGLRRDDDPIDYLAVDVALHGRRISNEALAVPDAMRRVSGRVRATYHLLSHAFRLEE
jgi:hypothetical protein